MATSSIFTDIKIKDPEKAEIFINVLDSSANEPKREVVKPDILPMSDKNEIRKFMAKKFLDL